MIRLQDLISPWSKLLMGNQDRFSDLEQANLQLDIEAREAHNARRRAEDMLAEETLKAAAALKALDE